MSGSRSTTDQLHDGDADVPAARRTRGRWIGRSVVAVLAVVGALLIAVAFLSQRQAPQPPPAAAADPGSTAAAPSGEAAAGVSPPIADAGAAAPAPPAGAAGPTGPLLPRSVPVALDVPRIGVHSDLLTLGLNRDRTVEVPPLGPKSPAGWYSESPTPGEVGPAVLLGHVDSARYGPGVFFELGALGAGDEIEVTRADRTVATFRVDRVVSYPKAGFPSLEVYGNTPNAQLRLITCGGVFDPAAHHYEDNTVVYADLVSGRQL